uniref:Uncharacterized protein n=1 Tax=Bionectria ochroleuca TaxID=29856 RepID=A0A8H7NF01_BIOOC
MYVAIPGPQPTPLERLTHAKTNGVTSSSPTTRVFWRSSRSILTQVSLSISLIYNLAAAANSKPITTLIPNTSEPNLPYSSHFRQTDRARTTILALLSSAHFN